MKKFGFLLVALLALWACSDDDTTPQQEVTCSITAPAEGTVIDLATAASMTIKGEGAVNVGKIESVVSVFFNVTFAVAAFSLQASPFTVNSIFISPTA